MKKNQKKKNKRTKQELQNEKEIYLQALEENIEYLKRLGDSLFELSFTDVFLFAIQ